jgi:hypothetical protein
MTLHDWSFKEQLKHNAAAELVMARASGTKRQTQKVNITGLVSLCTTWCVVERCVVDDA